MSRYIDADALDKFIDNTHFEDDADYGMMSDLVRNFKTADVRENVKGEWLSGDCMGASCSKCGEYFSFRTFSEVHNFNFCPNCGADMRGKA